MSYIDRQIHMSYPPDTSLGWMMIFSFLFHGLLFLAILGLSTLTFGRGPYIPTIYQVELVSLSAQPLASPAPSVYKVKMPPAPKLAVESPIIESPSEPAVVVPKRELEKKRTTSKDLTQKRTIEEVKKLPPIEKKRVDKKKISRPVKKKTEPIPDETRKLEEIKKQQLLAAQSTRSREKAKPSVKDEPDIQILGGPSGRSLLGRAHFGAVATLRMKIYLNQIRDRIESVLVWPSTLEVDEDWITRASI